MPNTSAPITTHVLNLSSGKPVSGLLIHLRNPDANLQTKMITGLDGRITEWEQKPLLLTRGIWHLEFDTKTWFQNQGENCFFNDIQLSFTVDDIAQHYHVPLLLNAYGFTTYRGS